MLHLEWAGTVQLFCLCALLNMIYDRYNLRFGAIGSDRSIADGDGWCHLSPGREVETWAHFSCGKLDISMAIA